LCFYLIFFPHPPLLGQVIALGAESLLVGHPVDGDGLSFGRDVRVAAAHHRHHALFGILGIGQLRRALLLLADLVLALETARKK